MRTFKVTFPNSFGVACVSLIVIGIMTISFASFIWAVHHSNSFAMYFQMIPIIIILVAVFAMRVVSKNIFLINKTIELYHDRIIIKGNEQSEILFKSIRNYEYTLFRGTVGISIKQINGKKVFINGGANKKENLVFLESLNQEIEKQISTGELPLIQKKYAPFVETKRGLVALFGYSVFALMTFYLFKNSHYLKLIIAVNCFMAFIGLTSYLLFKERSKSSKRYQLKDTRA